LGNDYYQFDQARHALIGERTHHHYRLSDRLRVKVARVDLETARIDFTLPGVSEAAAPVQKSKKRKRS
jgi:ribonuclease R